MVSWGRFRRSAPDLAAAGRALLYRSGVGLAYLGTVRADGGPRVHPVSPLLVEDGLYTLLMVSPKLEDLLRDDRFALHTFPMEAGEEAFYLTGRAIFPRDQALRRSVSAAFVAERALAAPPPGFAQHVLVELLVGTCVLSQAGQHVTWAAADGSASELPAGRHRAVL
ncbi:pyridoxamine 5'-phosphate oxidase family protein [Dactylosporangium sp. CA-092794]|uniref:pyridoxamine 5'-phosphate oxidase family protein n=1 Tax=Dactylosporangium sp. CA-092794 TaxID=3239929 RepID=UPI003D90D9D2